MNKGLEALDRLNGNNRTGHYDEIDIDHDIATIKEELERLENLKLTFSLLRQYIRLSNIRGECSITMNGISHKKISEELYNSLLEIFYEN